MIIESKKDTYENFIYENRNLEEVTSYKYLRIDIQMINGGWKAYFGLENNYKSSNLVIWDKKFLFGTLVIHVILYVCEVWGCNITRESWRKIEQI